MKFVPALLVFCAVIPAMADVVNVSPSKLEFGNQALTTSSTQSVVLANPTRNALNIFSIAADSGFSVTFSSCGAVLPAENQCTISVTFTPTAIGLFAGTLRIDDDSNQTPEKIKLSGTGVPVQLTSITVTPANPAIAAGLRQQFAATGIFNTGATQDLTGSATWTSSATGIATIAAGGLATSLHPGPTTIKAMSDAVSGSAILTVGPPVLQSIVVTPANPRITSGLTQQFTATGTYSDQTTQTLTNSVQWGSSPPGMATITATGLATATGSGIYPSIGASISASSGSVAGSTSLGILQPVLLSIAITPAKASVGIGLSLQLTAMGTFNNGLTAKLTNSLQWGPPDVVSASGLALSMYPGNVTITVSSCSNGCAIGTTNLEIGGVFVGVFPMSAVRFFHTATTLNNGKVLLAGGGSAICCSPTASSETYDPVAKTFTGGAGMSNPRMRHTATLLNSGKALVAGGLNSSEGSGATAEVFDPGTMTFAPGGGLAVGRFDHTSTLLLTGQVLIAGGNTATTELYDPGAGVFAVTGAMGFSRRGHTATLLNSGKVLVTGGADGNGISLASAEIYDPLTGQFTPIPGMTTARAFHRATLLNGGKVLLSGGFNGFSRPAAAELYDPDAGFMATGLMNAPRDAHTATLLTNGQVLIAGGEGSAGPLGTTEKYDPSSGIFSVTAINNNDHFDPTRIGHTATPAEQWTGSGRRRHSSGRGRPLSTQHLCAAGVDLDFCESFQRVHSSRV